MLKKLGILTKNFLYAMLASDGKISSKRVTGFICLLAIIETLQAVIWFGKNTPEELLYVLAGLITACFGMNTITALKSIGAKSGVASDIVNQEPNQASADDAKDVLNSSKP